jgi:hypothetical protein
MQTTKRGCLLAGPCVACGHACMHRCRSMHNWKNKLSVNSQHGAVLGKPCVCVCLQWFPAMTQFWASTRSYKASSRRLFTTYFVGWKEGSLLLVPNSYPLLTNHNLYSVLYFLFLPTPSVPN